MITTKSPTGTTPTNASSASSTLGERVYKALLDDILTGEIPPGTKISEVELAQKYGVSRGPLRDALRQLERIRLVVHTPHLGARVVDLSLEAIVEVFLVREAMEGMAARLAATRMTDAEIDALERLLDAHEQDLKEKAIYDQYDGDLDFHGRIVAGARNDLIDGLVCRDLYYILRLYRAQHAASRSRGQRALTEHRRILDAIRDRDPELAEIMMRRHIANARLNLEKNLHVAR